MKIVYITSCFATQSHTFIRREIDALRKLGLNIDLYGVRKENSITPDLQDYADETTYLYPLSLFNVVWANLLWLFKQPGKYLKGLVKAFTSRELSAKRKLKMVYHYFVSAVFAKQFSKHKIQHIHAHFMNVSSSVAMYASWHSGIPFSITVHSAGTYGTDHILGVEQKLKQAQALLMISENNINYFGNYAQCREKSIVVRCGMDLNNFSTRDYKRPSDDNTLALLAVGRFVEKKGFEHLLNAIALLYKTDTNFRLTLIGSGPLEESLKRQASTLNIASKVDFTGQQSTEFVKEQLLLADAVIVPSVTSASGEQEGLPVVIMEAMACGVPVIASAHSGIPELVIDEQTGILVPEKNAEAITHAIQKIRTLDLNVQVKAAYDKLSAEFNIDTVAQQRLSIFTGLIRNNVNNLAAEMIKAGQSQ